MWLVVVVIALALEAILVCIAAAYVLRRGVVDNVSDIA